MPALKPSKRTFGPTLKALMRKKKMSFRQLQERTKEADPEGKGLSPGFLSHLATGKRQPLIERIELIAKALDVDAVHFREYREHIIATEANKVAERIGFNELRQELKKLKRS